MPTLAEQIRKIFERLKDKAAQNGQTSLIDCWTEVLDASSISLYDALAIVQAALRRLSVQVANARELDDTSRKVAFNIISGLNECIAPKNLHSGVGSYSARYSDDRLGSLGLLASALRSESQETGPSQDELEAIRKELADIEAFVRDADIAPALKSILIRHLTFMAWAISNADLLGVPTVYEGLARAMFTISLVPAPKSDPQKGAEMTARFWKLASRIYSAFKIAGTVDKGTDGFQRIADNGAELIRHLTNSPQ